VGRHPDGLARDLIPSRLRSSLQVASPDSILLCPSRNRARDDRDKKIPASLPFFMSLSSLQSLSSLMSLFQLPASAHSSPHRALPFSGIPLRFCDRAHWRDRSALWRGGLALRFFVQPLRGEGTFPKGDATRPKEGASKKIVGQSRTSRARPRTAWALSREESIHGAPSSGKNRRGVPVCHSGSISLGNTRGRDQGLVVIAGDAEQQQKDVVHEAFPFSL
jgi:hypothetical protein